MNIDFKKNETIFNIEHIISVTVILICMLMFLFFPHNGLFQEFFLSAISLFLIPFFYVKIVLKRSLTEFGFQLRAWKAGWVIVPLSFLAMSLLVYFVFQYTNFKEVYFLGKYSLINNFWYLLMYEFLAVNFFVILYEIFFRGFVMFYFERIFNIYAVFIQFLIFIILLVILPETLINYIFYAALSFFAGLIAYKSKSLVYSYLFSIIVLIAIDLIYLRITR
jgi:hypothetical protein